VNKENYTRELELMLFDQINKSLQNAANLLASLKELDPTFTVMDITTCCGRVHASVEYKE